MQIENKMEKFLKLIILAIAAAGIILRFNGLSSRSLEYDEIWTVQHYLGLPLSEIFSRLATPNNHPLHTLFVQWSTGPDGLSFLAIRLPAFLFGCLTILLAMFFTWKVTKRKDAVLFSGACIAFCGYLIHFSQTARGYSMQTFFVLLTAMALYWLSRHKSSLFYGGMFLLSAIASCLTITSGLAFVCALCGAYLIAIFRPKALGASLRENKIFLIAAALFVLFAASWYGSFYLEIKAGQVFGYPVHHPWEFLKFSGSILGKLFLFPFVLIHAAVLFRKEHPGRKISLFALSFIGLTLLSALATKAGPDRVYLPIFPVAAVASAMVLPGLLASLKKEKLITPFFCILALVLALPMHSTKKSQESPDYIPLVQEIIQTVPKDTFVNFAPLDCYPIRYNSQEIILDLQHRLSMGHFSAFLQVNAPDRIVVYDGKTGNPISFDLPAGSSKRRITEQGVPLDCYALLPLTPQSEVKGKMLFLAIQPQRRAFFQQMYFSLNQSGNWFLTNPFLSSKLFDAAGGELISSAWFCPAAEHDAAYYLQYTGASGGKWKFYLLNHSKK